MTENFSIDAMQHRSKLLLGTATMDRLASTRVILFGVGGVGSWCAEALIRSGLGHLTIVDFDVVNASNCNRQLMATTETVGQVKVHSLRERLLTLNPTAEIVAIEAKYEPDTADRFCLEQYDFVIDAIDSLPCKADLILRATSLEHTTLISSMGAALRTDPFSVRKAEFWQVKGDALARALRNRFKREKRFPARKFYCVYSEQPALENMEEPGDTERANGSLCHITAIFGMAIAGIVVDRLMRVDA